MNLLFAVALAVTVTGTAAEPTTFTADLVRGDEIYVTRFDDIVAMVIDADEAEQNRFAAIALDLLIAAYEIELEHASIRAAPTTKDPAGWRSGTWRYVEQLKRIAELVRLGAPIQTIRERDGDVRLVIGTEQVMLNAPRLDGQVRFEQEIAEQMCQYTSCSARPSTIEERVQAETANLESSWVFARNMPPTYSSSDGLRCIFTDQRHMKLKKEACLAVVTEVRMLAGALTALRTHQKFIDWREVRIAHVGAGQAQKVIYSSNGDFVRMRLPQLSRAESVWRGALPWLEARVSGREMQYVINLPNQLAYRSPITNNDYEIN